MPKSNLFLLKFHIRSNIAVALATIFSLYTRLCFSSFIVFLTKNFYVRTKDKTITFNGWTGITLKVDDILTYRRTYVYVCLYSVQDTETKKSFTFGQINQLWTLLTFNRVGERMLYFNNKLSII